MRHHMRSRVLLGTALLLTGIGVATAQGMKEGQGGGAGGPSPGMSGGERGGGAPSAAPSAEPRGGGGAGKSEMRGGPSGGGQQMDRGRVEKPSMQDRTTGQGSSESKQSAPEPKAGKSASEPKASQPQRQPDKGQAQRERGQKDLTTGQGSSESKQPSTDTKSKASQPQPSQQPQRQQTQTPSDSKSGTTGSGTATQQQSQPSGAATQGSVTLDAQKQASIQQSVLSARNAPRVSNVNFAVSTGTVVPSHVRFVSLSTFPILIETFPQYRDYSFFIVEEEIVIIEPRSRRIVQVVPVGSGRASRGGGTSVEVLQLSEPEIREVQLVLVQRGLLVQADVTGVLNERTKTALISFQRQQGLQTSGSIDVRTVSALGLQNKVGPQKSGAAGSSTTTGQGSNTGSNTGANPGSSGAASGTQQPSQQPSGQQGQTGAQQPSAQPNTMGQGGGQQSGAQGQNQPATGQQQPSAASQSQSGQGASTTGQGNAQDSKSPPNQSRQNSNPASSAPAQ